MQSLRGLRHSVMRGRRGRRWPRSNLFLPAAVWWTNPVLAALTIPGVTLLLAMSYSDADYRRLWGSPRALGGQGFLELGCGLLVFVVAAQLAVLHGATYAAPPLEPTARQVQLLQRAARVTFFMTLLGDSFLLASAAGSGMLSPSTFTGELGSVKIPTVPGVTTFSQCSVAFTVIAVWLLRRGNLPAPVRRRLTRQLWVVLLFCVFRTVINAERLASLEVLVPAVVVIAITTEQGSRQARSARGAPLVLVPAVFAIFAAMESTRSWRYYRTHGQPNFGRFIVERFAGYYVTGYNNGAIQMRFSKHSAMPYNTLEFLWDFPGIRQANLYERLGGIPNLNDYYNMLLTQRGNPEFNNPGGLALPFIDFGTVGALVFLAVSGVVAGIAYARLSRSVGMQLLYPMLFLTIAETPRYLWLAQGRAFPSVVCILVIAVLLSRRRD